MRMLFPSFVVVLIVAGLLWPGGRAEAQSGDGASGGGGSDASERIDAYADLVHRSYQAAYKDAERLRGAIDTFLADPTEKTMEAAKRAWLNARQSYGQTEAFRFYGGPIDVAGGSLGGAGGEPGPEGRLNAWPLNEAHIDYVKGDPEAGIIQNTDVPVNQIVLLARNAAEDEKDVTTGYHAIEFLLWGQDFSTHAPGHRPLSDYTGDGEIAQRRRKYLDVATDQLLQDLRYLIYEWEPNVPGNYAARFRDIPDEAALSKIFTGLAMLSGFELASERISVPLQSGDQEDEHSCFSDNTHNDYIANAQGIYNVYFGEYDERDYAGLNELVAQADPELNRELERHIERTVEMTRSLEPPIDRALAGESPETRRTLEKLVPHLLKQAQLLTLAAEALGAEVTGLGQALAQ